MMFMAKFFFPVAGALLYLMVGAMGWRFIGLPLPVHVARFMGIAAIAGTAAFIGSALAWSEPRANRIAPSDSTGMRPERR